MMQIAEQSPSERTEALSGGARRACSSGGHAAGLCAKRMAAVLEMMLPHMAETSNADNANMA